MSWTVRELKKAVLVDEEMRGSVLGDDVGGNGAIEQEFLGKVALE